MSALNHLLLLLLLSLHHVYGDGTINVKFVNFTNPSGAGSNTHCCDGKWGMCVYNGCDHMFEICLAGERSSPSDMSDCDYGRYETKDFPDQNNITFSSDMKGVTNPLSFSFDGNTPGFVLKVKVDDHDGWVSANDAVDTLTQVIDLERREQVLEIQGQITKLTVVVSVKCGTDYYGPNCEYCAPSIKYTCTQDGGKVCNPGWRGQDCEQGIPTTPAPPPVYQNRASFDCETRWRNNPDATYELPAALWSIRPRPGGPDVLTHCRRDDNAAGWTLLQRNYGTGERFNKSWSEFKRGFGSPSPGKSFWIGLDTMYYLTNARDYKLRIEMLDHAGGERVAQYRSFRVDSERNGYAIHIDGFSGNAGDSFPKRTYGTAPQNGAKFSSRDRDNDAFPQGNCAQRYDSGWWYSNCYQNNLNGHYAPSTGGTCEDLQCIAWNTSPGASQYSLLEAAMWILPN